jgi:hypothetical protein
VISCFLANHEQVWESVLPGLQAMYSRGEGHDWDVAQVRAMLDEGVWLLICDVNDPTAFAVIEIDHSPYHDDAIEFFVVLAYHRGGNAIARFQPQLELVARNAGARFMRFRSRRRGMLKIATRVGYCPRSVEYEKEL